MLKTVVFLDRKYPFHYISMRKIIIISICVGLFLLILKPFGFINYDGNTTIASLGFSLVTFISLILVNFIKKNLFKGKVKWTIFREIHFLSFVILIISIGNHLLLSIIIKDYRLSFIHLTYSIFLTFCIGIFPISFITVLRYNRLKNNKLGVIINDGNVENVVNDIIKFTSLNKTDEEIIISKKDFLYLEAIRNNIHIFYYDEEEVKTISIRNTLKNIENRLSHDRSIFRCHRSFIVNTNNIKTANGNSNGYKIYFNNYDKYIPVSRSYTINFRDLIY